MVVKAVKKAVQKEPKVLYNENCGWAVSKGYHYPSKPHIYVVEKRDTIRFWSEKTKQKWLKKKDAKKQADKFWKIWHGDDGHANDN